MLVQATAKCQSLDGDSEVEVAHRLLRASGRILFRPARADESKDDNKTLCTCEAIRDRFRHAAAGHWLALAEECLEDTRVSSQGAIHCRDHGWQDGITDAALQAAAMKSRHGADKVVCQILAGGPRVPPGPETDAKVGALFRTQPLEEAHAQELGEALAAASATRRRNQIGPKFTSRCGARLQLAAGPGPSGFRNTYITSIHSHPDGAMSLVAWATAWAQADVRP